LPAGRVPDDAELYRAIPMGYTTMTLMERVALVHSGRRQRIWEHDGYSQQTPLQPYQLILPPTGSKSYQNPTRGYLRLGATWPFKWAVRDAEALSARMAGPVLVCRVLNHQNWH
jgi:hypothetical protein